MGRHLIVPPRYHPIGYFIGIIVFNWQNLKLLIFILYTNRCVGTSTRVLLYSDDLMCVRKLYETCLISQSYRFFYCN